MTLAEFLLARITEDEADALPYVQNGNTGRWKAGAPGGVWLAEPSSYRVVDDMGCGPVNHIARWDPARVLAECKAKRRIVKIAEAPRHEMKVLPDLENLLEGYSQAFYDAMLELAQPYSDHPDYRQEWAC